MPTSILLRADQVIEEACLLQRMSLFGTKRKWRDVPVESDMRGEADILRQNLSVHYCDVSVVLVF
jgi:hypothetical protein